MHSVHYRSDPKSLESDKWSNANSNSQGRVSQRQPAQDYRTSEVPFPVWENYADQMSLKDDPENRKFVLLLERDDLGLQNFAPDAGLRSLRDIREFIQKRSLMRKADGLPEETFFVAEVIPTPLTGSAIDDLWEDDAVAKLRATNERD